MSLKIDIEITRLGGERLKEIFKVIEAAKDVNPEEADITIIIKDKPEGEPGEGTAPQQEPEQQSEGQW